MPAVEDVIGRKVTFVPDCVGADAKRLCQNARDGNVLLLENLRFHTAEEGKGEIKGEKVKASEAEI